jgi:predicted small lipoprotein YifL
MRLAYTAVMRVTRFPLQLTPLVLLALAGCGQTGPLYLPDAGVETPVEIRGPTTAAPEPAPAPAPVPEPEDKDKKSDQPPGP